MKFILLLLMSLSLLLGGCSKAELNLESDKSEEMERQCAQYDQLSTNLAASISRSLQQSPEFRQLIKTEALKQFDGDYDVLLSQIVDVKIPVVSGVTTRASSDFTVKELLDHFVSDELKTTRSANGSVLDEIQALYPDMQISVPIHIEEWDQENYIPIVCVIPSDFEDLKTPFVNGYDADGNLVEVDAINPPAQPVIVVGPSERAGIIIGGGGGGFPTNILGAPCNVAVVYQNGAARLSWGQSMSVGIGPKSYYVYRSGPNSSNDFKIIATIKDINTKTFIDWDVMPDKEYVYQIASSSNTFDRAYSEKVYLVANYNKPESIIDFSIKADGIEVMELKWRNPDDEFYNTEIRRKDGLSGSGYKTIATLTPEQDLYRDFNVDAGVKYTYAIRKVDYQSRYSNMIESFAYATYRNPNAQSMIYLKQIVCNWSEVESWISGKPEFYLKAVGLNKDLNATVLGAGNDVQFTSKTGVSQILYNTPIHNWSYFNDNKYYPAITFVLEEYEVPNVKARLTVTAKAGVKKGENLELSAVGEVTVEFAHKGQQCGEASILYFENPEQWIYFPRYGAKILISAKP